MESEEQLWIARLGEAKPRVRRMIKWYLENDPNHPFYLQHLEHKRDAKIRKEAARKSPEEIRVAQQQVDRQRNLHKLRVENQTYVEKMRLGLLMKLRVSDDPELLELHHVIQPGMSVAQLESECSVYPGGIDRKWFKSLLSKLTDDTYEVIDDLIQLKVKLSDVIPLENSEVVLLAEAPVYEEIQELAIVEDVPTIVKTLVPVEIPPEDVAKMRQLEDCSHYDDATRRSYTFGSNKKIFGYNTNELPRNDYAFLRFGLALCHVRRKSHFIHGSWKIWAEEARYRYPVGDVLSLALRGSGLKKIAADCLLQTTIRYSLRIPTNKIHILLTAALSDHSLPPDFQR